LVCFSSDPYSLPLKLTTLRIFTQKEVELARARIGPTDSKPLTGLSSGRISSAGIRHGMFTSVSVFRMATFAQVLTKNEKSRCTSHSQLNSANPEDLVRLLLHSTPNTPS
jgi:hypothetical protein